MFHNRTKHVDIQHYYVKKTVANGNIKLKYVLTDNIIADRLTKALFADKFNKFRNSIRLRILDG